MNEPNSAPAPAAVTKPHFVGIDIVKILALFLVVSVHFFLYSGFYSTPITREFGQFEIYVRWFTYCCVPLFMITTGYLMKNKKLEKKYYFGVLRVLILYLVISVICVLSNHFFHGRNYSAWEFVRGLFMYSDAQYAWYVEYYFTIFLLIPFINLAFNGLKTRNQKLAMLVTVAAVSVFSQSLYIGFDRDTQIRLIPGYFSRCYPIAYYLFGAFLRDCPPKRNAANKLYYAAGLAVALTWLSNSTFQQSLTNDDNNNIFLSWHYNDYGSWPVFTCSCLIFLLLFDITTKNKKVTAVLKVLSRATFAGYLVSYCFDQVFYNHIVADYPTMEERCAHAYIIVLKVFGCAMVSGLILQGLYDLGEKGVRAIAAKVRETQALEAAQAGLPVSGAAAPVQTEQTVFAAPDAENNAEPEQSVPKDDSAHTED